MAPRTQCSNLQPARILRSPPTRAVSVGEICSLIDLDSNDIAGPEVCVQRKYTVGTHKIGPLATWPSPYKFRPYFTQSLHRFVQRRHLPPVRPRLQPRQSCLDRFVRSPQSLGNFRRVAFPQCFKARALPVIQRSVFKNIALFVGRHSPHTHSTCGRPRSHPRRQSPMFYRESSASNRTHAVKKLQKYGRRENTRTSSN